MLARLCLYVLTITVINIVVMWNSQKNILVENRNTDDPETEDLVTEFTRLSYLRIKHDKWVVVKMAAEGKPVKFAMTMVEGWKIVVSGHAPSPPSFCRIPNCFYICPSNINNIGLDLPDNLLTTEIGLTMSSYLFAIQHGAKFIVSVSPTVDSVRLLERFEFNPRTSGIVYNESFEFDPVIFTMKSVNQRTPFTTEHSANEYPVNFQLQDEMNPALQLPMYKCYSYGHGYENTKIKLNNDTKIRSQRNLAPLYVGSGQISNINSDVKLFTHDAFWALFVEMVDMDSKMDLIHAFVIKVFGLLDYHVMYLPFKACIKQSGVANRDVSLNRNTSINRENSDNRNANRNRDDYSNRDRNDSGNREATDTENNRRKSEIFNDIASTCTRMSLTQCAVKLMQNLRAKSLLTKTDTDNIEQWLFVLQYVKYEPPKLEKLNKTSLATKNIPMFMSTHMYSNSGSEFLKELSKNTMEFIRPQNLCPNIDMSWENPIIDDVMLIVSFNEVRWYNNIPYIELMYRRYFKNILYCGPQPPEFSDFLRNHTHLNTFFYVEGLSRGWEDMYECTQYAMMMNFRVKGYLQIGDDTLVNVWNMFRVPDDRIILPSIVSWYNRSSEEKQWYYWDYEYGRAALNKVFAELEDSALFGENELAKTFLQTYKRNVLYYELAFYRGGDFFYMPNSIRDLYIYISKVGLRHRLMDEVALPTFSFGFLDSQRIFRVNDGSLWLQQSRQHYRVFYKVDKLFVHPFKLSAYLYNQTGSNFFCDVYMATSVSKIRQLSLGREPPIKDTGIVWNNFLGGPKRPGEKTSFLK